VLVTAFTDVLTPFSIVESIENPMFLIFKTKLPELKANENEEIRSSKMNKNSGNFNLKEK
jgi:hypothetical protein